MSLILPSQRTNLFLAFTVATGITVFWFWLTWRYGFDLADEGFYWYGAQRVLHGAMPMRDFMSYDIGRYYWAASFMYFLGDEGVFGARVSAAAYQMLGTFLGVYVCLLTLRQQGALRWVFAILVGCILTVWVVPYYKVYDRTTNILIVALLLLLLKVAKPAAWLAAGVGLGVAAMMGRNHGVYGAVAATLVIAMLLFKAPSRRSIIGLVGYFVMGILLGFAPTVAMMFMVEGFASAFFDSLVMMLRYGATNIALPVPWPWDADVGGIGVLLSAVLMSVGLGFVYLLVFPAVGLLVLARRRFDLIGDLHLVFLAAIAAAIPYAHYAFSRADVTHLALGILPAVIGLLAVIGAMKGVWPLALATGVLAVSVLSVGDSNEYFAVRLLKRNALQADVGGQQIWMSPGVYKRLQVSTQALAGQASGVGKFLAIPDMTSLYAIYHSEMPLWEIYSLIPRDSEFEAREIKRLESFVPDLVLLSDHALDGRPEFRYSQMHPLTYAWILSRYQLTDDSQTIANSDVRVYTRKR